MKHLQWIMDFSTDHKTPTEGIGIAFVMMMMMLTADLNLYIPGLVGVAVLLMVSVFMYFKNGDILDNGWLNHFLWVTMFALPFILFAIFYGSTIPIWTFFIIWTFALNLLSLYSMDLIFQEQTPKTARYIRYGIYTCAVIMGGLVYSLYDEVNTFITIASATLMGSALLSSYTHLYEYEAFSK